MEKREAAILPRNSGLPCPGDYMRMRFVEFLPPAVGFTGSKWPVISFFGCAAFEVRREWREFPSFLFRSGKRGHVRYGGMVGR